MSHLEEIGPFLFAFSSYLRRASEELDFIIKYDIKFRMGGADNDEED